MRSVVPNSLLHFKNVRATNWPMYYEIPASPIDEIDNRYQSISIDIN